MSKLFYDPFSPVGPICGFCLAPATYRPGRGYGCPHGCKGCEADSEGDEGASGVVEGDHGDGIDQPMPLFSRNADFFCGPPMTVTFKGTESGRLDCSKPNRANVPKPDPMDLVTTRDIFTQSIRVFWASESDMEAFLNEALFSVTIRALGWIQDTKNRKHWIRVHRDDWAWAVPMTVSGWIAVSEEAFNAFECWDAHDFRCWLDRMHREGYPFQWESIPRWAMAK